MNLYSYLERCQEEAPKKTVITVDDTYRINNR